MNIFDLNKEIGKEIPQERLRAWHWSTAASPIPKSEIKMFHEIINPKLGDLALVQVQSIGNHHLLEEESGNRLNIFPGTIFVGCFGNRYAPDEYEGHIPDTLYGHIEVDLLNVGGTIGKVIAGNSVIGEPTKLRILSFLTDQSGNIANSLNYIQSNSKHNSKKPQSKKGTKLILVTGASMNSGKSNTAKAIIYSLTSAGKTVVAGKVTGTSAKKDAILMKTAGALDVCDFTSFGYPSTYLLPKKEMLKLFWTVYNYLESKCEDNGYIVLEIADGIFQRETEMLLKDKDIQSLATHIVFSCSDSLSAVSGIERLEKDYGIKASAISGPSANSPLGLNEIRRYLKDIPAFNNMSLDVTTIAPIFTSDKIQTQEVIEEKSENIQVHPETIVENE